MKLKIGATRIQHLWHLKEKISMNLIVHWLSESHHPTNKNHSSMIENYTKKPKEKFISSWSFNEWVFSLVLTQVNNGQKRNRALKKKTPSNIKKTFSDFYYSLEDYLKQTVNSLSPICQFQTHHRGGSTVNLRGTTVGKDHRKVSVHFTATLWLREHGIRRSEVRFLMRTRNFFFVIRSWQDEKHLS